MGEPSKEFFIDVRGNPLLTTWPLQTIYTNLLLLILY